MNDYLIATASTCDIDAGWLNEHNVPFISYSFIIDDVPYEDDCKEETKQFVYKKMREGKSVSTSAIPVFAYEEFFRSLLETGKDIIFTDMSRAISSSIENCERAIMEVSKDFPNQKVYFMDSFNITGGLALFVKQLVRLHEEGKTFDEVVEWGEAHKKEYIYRFMVEDLQWLRRGGRLSNASAFVGTLLAIKPMLFVGNDGKLVAFKKEHGRKKCLRSLIESMKDCSTDETAQEEFTIISADDDEDCLKEIENIKETYPELKDTNFTITHLGPTICAHVGPDFMALTFRGKNREI